MDEYEQYIFNQIQKYSLEAAREPATKGDNDLLIYELIDALVQYRILGGSIK